MNREPTARTQSDYLMPGKLSNCNCAQTIPCSLKSLSGAGRCMLDSQAHSATSYISCTLHGQIIRVVMTLYWWPGKRMSLFLLRCWTAPLTRTQLPKIYSYIRLKLNWLINKMMGACVNMMIPSLIKSLPTFRKPEPVSHNKFSPLLSLQQPPASPPPSQLLRSTTDDWQELSLTQTRTWTLPTPDWMNTPLAERQHRCSLQTVKLENQKGLFSINVRQEMQRITQSYIHCLLDLFFFKRCLQYF